MAAEVALDRLGRQSNTSHFFGSVPAVCQMVAAGREVGFWNPLQVHPSIYPSIHQCVSDWLGDTSQELRFSVLEMKTVQIVLNSSLRRIMGETLVLMSDNSGASQKNKRVFLDMCRLALEVITSSELHMVNITTRFIPEKNILLDQLSRPG